MSMGDVFAFFGGLLSLGVAVPGLLLTWALLLPTPVARARQQLVERPGRCLILGCGGWLLGLPVCLALLFDAPAGLLKMLGLLGLALLLATASLGAAGLAGLMGERLPGGQPSLAPGSGQPSLTLGSGLLRGAVALELAAVVPIVGWFVVLPLAISLGLGAALLAGLSRRARPLASGAAAGESHVAHPA